jgi:hypothetical protein
MTVRKCGRGAMRLISAVLALALLVAHVLGGYAHAAGHNHPDGHATCAHDDSSAPAPLGGKLTVPDEGDHCRQANHIDACDFMCHGGLAILVDLAVEHVDARTARSSTVADIVHLLLAVSLERPPRSAVGA